MIYVIICIVCVILNIIICIFNFKKKSVIVEQPKLQEEDQLLSDILNYAFNKNLQCSIRPNKDGKPTLFCLEDNAEYIITELYSTDSKPDSESYQKILKELTDKIDNFIENRIKKDASN